MEWLAEIAGDERLGNEWEWYAHRKFLILEGKEPLRIIDEPLSADDAWEFEVCTILLFNLSSHFYRIHCLRVKFKFLSFYTPTSPMRPASRRSPSGRSSFVRQDFQKSSEIEIAPTQGIL